MADVEKSLRSSRSNRRWTAARLSAYRRNLRAPWVRQKGPERGWQGSEGERGEEGLSGIQGICGGARPVHETKEDMLMAEGQGAAFTWWSGMSQAERERVFARCRSKPHDAG